MMGKTNQLHDAMNARRLAAIIYSLMDAIIANSTDGSITDWNPAAERMFGYSAEEVIGQSISIIAP
jgi:sigma-B regulation protein RsbU (phosphoserine phosphatase)